jgi:hypothetical protein
VKLDYTLEVDPLSLDLRARAQGRKGRTEYRALRKKEICLIFEKTRRDPVLVRGRCV